MEPIVERGLLYDFYGELLTPHQRSIYEDAVLNDLSLTELAQEYDISRQAAHDIIKRCDRILFEYESKLKMMERFFRLKEISEEMNRKISEAQALCDTCEQIGKLKEISNLNEHFRDELQ
ncbi:MAG: DNA-binding protein [Lachnospiraceae bacterium]|nr:DNA-binding protein [Lachnospiraceae bacterium]